MRYVIAVLSILFLFSGCIKYEEVEMKSVEDITVKKFSGKGLTCEITAIVMNPNNYKISIVDSDFDVFINNKFMGKAKIQEKIVLPKNSESEHTFTVKTKVKSLASSFGSLISIMLTGKMNLRIKGEIKAKAKMISKKVPVEFEERVTI